MWIRNIGKNQLGRSLLESDVGQACDYLKTQWLAIDWWHQPVIFVTCTPPPTPIISSISSYHLLSFQLTLSNTPIPTILQPHWDLWFIEPTIFPSYPHLPPPCLKPMGCHYSHALHTPKRPLFPSGGTPNGWQQLCLSVLIPLQCNVAEEQHTTMWTGLTLLIWLLGPMGLQYTAVPLTHSFSPSKSFLSSPQTSITFSPISVLAEDLASYITGKILGIRKYFHKLPFINILPQAMVWSSV